MSSKGRAGGRHRRLRRSTAGIRYWVAAIAAAAFLLERPRQRSPGGRNRPTHNRAPGRDVDCGGSHRSRSRHRLVTDRAAVHPPPPPASGRLAQRRRPVRSDAGQDAVRPPRPARRPCLVQRRLRRLGRRLRLRPLRRRAATDRRPPPRSLPPSLQPSTRPEPSRGCPRSPSTPLYRAARTGTTWRWPRRTSCHISFRANPTRHPRNECGRVLDGCGREHRMDQRHDASWRARDRGEHARRNAAE